MGACLPVYRSRIGAVILARMKTKRSASKSGLSAAAQHRAFRRLVNQVLARFLKDQACHCQDDFQEILKKLQSIEDMLEIMAREMARQAKPDG